jgi:hypothetical protein
MNLEFLWVGEEVLLKGVVVLSALAHFWNW